MAIYLVIGKFPQHFSYQERSKITRQSANYSWIQGYLFKQGPYHILRICIREDGIHDISHACHDVPLGGHHSLNKTTYKILQVG